MKYLLSLLLCFGLLISCQAEENKKDEDKKEETKKEVSETLIIDVRTAKEFEGEKVKGAINIPHCKIAEEIAKHAKSNDQKIVLY